MITKNVHGFDKLRLYIYVIGYPNCGECIVCIVKNDSEVEFCSVTDCYLATNGWNYADAILRKNGIKKVDAFIWTHPDADHSTGIIPLIEKYGDEKNTLIYVPQGISASASFKDEINYLKTRFNHDRFYLYQEVSLFANEKPRPIPVITFKNVTNRTEISLRFNFMLPNSSQALRSAYGLKKFTPNELSLVYYLELNKCYYLFTGDMMNSSVQFLPQDDSSINDFTHRLEYIKIPHHSSKNTLQFVNYISDHLIDKQNGRPIKNLSSVTTIFLKQGLPQKLVMDRYKDFSSYLATTDTGTKRYGCVLTEFDYKANMVFHKTFGNAKEIIVDGKATETQYTEF